jgi:hypothetical protein
MYRSVVMQSILLGSLAVVVPIHEARADVTIMFSAPSMLLEITGRDYDTWRKTGIACAPVVSGLCRCASSNGGYSDRERRAVMIARPEEVRCPGGGLTGRWTYRDIGSGFTDTHILFPDGTARGNGDPTNGTRATWRLAGGELVLTWSNRWINRYRVSDPNANQLSGEAIPPDGSPPRKITFTRQ